jgi:ATP-dependent RNA helicase DeaD
MPQPEELVANTPEARQAAKQERHRPGFDDTVWFRLAVGRRQNADPKWILPVLCRRGHVTRGEIGAIRIGADETFVEIPRAAAGKFADALKRTAAAEAEAGEEVLAIEPSERGPREIARENRRQPGGAPRGKPKVHRKGGPNKPQARPHAGKPAAAGKKPWPKKPRV